jgi:NTE family protein
MSENVPVPTVMAECDKKRSGIALCLSGGGFRASLFHLGALRRLNELGVLARLAALSSVSGGSIFSAFLANQCQTHGIPSGLAFANWEAQVAVPFRSFVSRDLRTFPVLAHLLWNWYLPSIRVRHVERRYGRRLTRLRLSELPQSPEFIICATDLVFGVNWEFRRDGGGDYQAGYATSIAEWPLARAVAASACFPPVFGPVRVGLSANEFETGNYRGDKRDKLVEAVCLSDGGVYDNMGLEPVWKNHEWVLVSDCGAPFGFQASKTPVRRLLRYTGVVTNQAIALRKRLFFSSLNKEKFRGAYWGIASTNQPDEVAGGPAKGYSCDLVEEVIDKIRTDLDAFTVAEQCVLENHGYLVADDSLRRHAAELLGSAIPAPAIPHPDWMDEAKVRKALKNSHRRFSVGRIITTMRERRK